MEATIVRPNGMFSMLRTRGPPAAREYLKGVYKGTTPFPTAFFSIKTGGRHVYMSLPIMEMYLGMGCIEGSN